MDSGIARRAERHAALAEPHRLAIIDELAVTDRSPRELADRLGLASNLLAHHLDVLAAAGLITRLASSGDQRRRYVRLCPAPLAQLVGTPARPVGRVLFVCTHNAARSQLAAALWTHRTGRRASSAGTRPAAEVHPGAVAAAYRAGLDLRGATPRPLNPNEPADTVVTVCDRAHEELDPPADWWHWSIPDPVERGDDDAFDAVLADLDHRIDALA
ncbi:MAG: helix-turn-helix domain-containing protein [Acidimicrobiales bacterium]